MEQKEVMVDAGEDLAGWENVVLDAVSLPGARGCVEVCGIGIGFWEKTCLCFTLLHTWGDERVVDWVLEQGGEVKIGNEMGDTPLWIAYWHGQLGVVKMLVESATSRDGHVEVVEYLLDLGVLDVDERDNGGEVVRVLVEKGGVDLDARV